MCSGVSDYLTLKHTWQKKSFADKGLAIGMVHAAARLFAPG
jgi:hypothetical protein